jgi:hypothetical protein
MGRHDLRTALRASLANRSGHRLCRRRGDEIRDHRPRHSRHRPLLRAVQRHASALDAGLLGDDGALILPVGFILGVLADGFEKLQIVPMLILTPLTFLGGTFYSLRMLPELWQKITLFNPVVYLISGFRWAFYGISDINIGVSIAAISGFLVICLSIVYWIFSTGYRLKT